jgi:hypothetical protein
MRLRIRVVVEEGCREKPDLFLQPAMKLTSGKALSSEIQTACTPSLELQ